MSEEAGRFVGEVWLGREQGGPEKYGSSGIRFFLSTCGCRFFLRFSTQSHNVGYLITGQNSLESSMEITGHRSTSRTNTTSFLEPRPVLALPGDPHQHCFISALLEPCRYFVQS